MEGTKPLWGYINKRRATVEEWVDLWTIFKVCTKETGYEGGGRMRNQWWRHAAVEQQLNTKLKDILEAAWDRRQRESIRRGGGEGGEE